MPQQPITLSTHELREAAAEAATPSAVRELWLRWGGRENIFWETVCEHSRAWDDSLLMAAMAAGAYGNPKIQELAKNPGLTPTQRATVIGWLARRVAVDGRDCAALPAAMALATAAARGELSVDSREVLLHRLFLRGPRQVFVRKERQVLNILAKCPELPIALIDQVIVRIERKREIDLGSVALMALHPSAGEAHWLRMLSRMHAQHHGLLAPQDAEGEAQEGNHEALWMEEVPWAAPSAWCVSGSLRTHAHLRMSPGVQRWALGVAGFDDRNRAGAPAPDRYQAAIAAALLPDAPDELRLPLWDWLWAHNASSVVWALIQVWPQRLEIDNERLSAVLEELDRTRGQEWGSQGWYALDESVYPEARAVYDWLAERVRQGAAPHAG